ncbi:MULTISPECIES: hypothetical protein [Paenibacillus]|uniref:hypothetical protein n=1 Tax=Paenibacillus TaxID=44249 RepID=UPI0003611AF8|nr:MULTISPECIES: hypothetical protein [Paenibacillus]WFA84602.1 hypothetical protein OGI70_27330 [Paenibacillus amylolyticus]
MRGNLICCKNLDFNKDRLCHTLGEVINRIEISTRPKVLEIYVLIKLSGIEIDKSYEVEVQFRNEDRTVVGYTDKFILYNRRGNKQVPGVDSSIKMKVVITNTGNFTMDLMIDGEDIDSYPIYIFDQGDS